MQGLDIFKTSTKETVGNSSVDSQKINRMPQISWMALKSNETVLREQKAKLFINRKNKCQTNFFGYEMRREKLEHLMTARMVE